MLVAAKRMGLSFSELNQITLAQFFEMFDHFYAVAPTTREATQADIDALFA